jgi:hypothetical protein
MKSGVENPEDFQQQRFGAIAQNRCYEPFFFNNSIYLPFPV